MRTVLKIQRLRVMLVRGFDGLAILNNKQLIILAT
jgi:hypothetical protein